MLEFKIVKYRFSSRIHSSMSAVISYEESCQNCLSKSSFAKMFSPTMMFVEFVHEPVEPFALVIHSLTEEILYVQSELSPMQPHGRNAIQYHDRMTKVTNSTNDI